MTMLLKIRLTEKRVCVKLISAIAGITQSVEYLTRNEEVEGSSPFSSSIKKDNPQGLSFLIYD